MTTYDTLAELVLAHEKAHQDYTEACRKSPANQHQILMAKYRWQDVVNVPNRLGACSEAVGRRFRAYLEALGIETQYFCGTPKKTFVVVVAHLRQQTARTLTVTAKSWRDALMLHPDIGPQSDALLPNEEENARNFLLNEDALIDFLELF